MTQIPPHGTVAHRMAPQIVAVSWWTGEDPVRLSCVPRLLPPRATGRPVSTDVVYGWTTKGLRGVKLRRFRVGAQWCTTRQELARWQAALTTAG